MDEGEGAVLRGGLDVSFGRGDVGVVCLGLLTRKDIWAFMMAGWSWAEVAPLVQSRRWHYPSIRTAVKIVWVFADTLGVLDVQLGEYSRTSHKCFSMTGGSLAEFRRWVSGNTDV